MTKLFTTNMSSRAAMKWSGFLRHRSECSLRLLACHLVLRRRLSGTSAASALTLTERPVSVKGSGSSFTLTMNSPPANTFTSVFMQQFIDHIYTLTERKLSVRTLVIKSALPTIFSSGFDLDELSKPQSREQMKEFLKLFREAFFSLYTAPFYTIAQVAGHAPAGGCALALACDYRIAMDSDKIKIGLTPTKVGITPPAWLIKLAENRFPSSHACERAVLPAQLHTPREALALGLVDQLASGGPEELERLVAFHLDRVHSTDQRAVEQLRLLFTRQVTGLMLDDGDLFQFVDSVRSPECQELLAKARRK